MHRTKDDKGTQLESRSDSTCSCSSLCVKMADRYCVPTSFFCLFIVVASWREKNRSTSCWYVTCAKFEQVSAGSPRGTSRLVSDEIN